MTESRGWAVILGASSGFGGATARELAQERLRHLRRAPGHALDAAQRAGDHQTDIEDAGRKAVFFNMNAADHDKRKAAMAQTRRGDVRQDDSFVRVLMHSLAFGALAPVIADEAQGALTPEADGDDAGRHGEQPDLLGPGPRRGRPAAQGQPHLRHDELRLDARHPQLRRRVGGQGRAGGAHPPARLRARAAGRHGQRHPRRRHRHAGPAPHPGRRRACWRRCAASNPSGRATTPEDIAQAIAALSDERLHWLTGNVLGVDGGEEITV